MCLDINSWAFRYQDSEYFEWFSARRKTEDLFRKMLKWKGLQRRIDIESTWRNWNNRNFNPSLVTKVFLYHLRDPVKFPILDANVWRAYRQLTGGVELNGRRIVKIPEDWERHYLSYKKFFDTCYDQQEDNIKAFEINGVNEQIVKRRILDRALWEYGRNMRNE